MQIVSRPSPALSAHQQPRHEPPAPASALAGLSRCSRGPPSSIVSRHFAPLQVAALLHGFRPSSSRPLQAAVAPAPSRLHTSTLKMHACFTCHGLTSSHRRLRVKTAMAALSRSCHALSRPVADDSSVAASSPLAAPSLRRHSPSHLTSRGPVSSELLSCSTTPSHRRRRL